MEAKQDEQISKSRKTNSLLEALLINQYNNQVLFDNLQRALSSPDRCVRESSIVSTSDDVITHCINLSFDSEAQAVIMMRTLLRSHSYRYLIDQRTLLLSIGDLIDGLFDHNWIHRCESLSSQSTSTVSRAIKWLSEQRDESDKQFLSLDRSDQQQQPDQWNQWFTEKQSHTRSFAERVKTALVKGRIKKNNGVLTINSIEAELKKDGRKKKHR